MTVEINRPISVGSCPGCGKPAQLVGDEKTLDFVIHFPPDHSCPQRTVHDAYLESQERIRELEEALADTNHVLALSLEGDLQQIEIDALRRALNKLVDGKTGRMRDADGN